MKRVTVMVLDSLGIGALPDAEAYGDVGANTLGHIIEAYGEIKIPNLKSLGLLATEDVSYGNKGNNLDGNPLIKGAFGRLMEQSKGKDTITGHWE
ncbi:MAG: phosphopentomutase, partial [Anaerovorax sp.]